MCDLNRILIRFCPPLLSLLDYIIDSHDITIRTMWSPGCRNVSSVVVMAAMPEPNRTEPKPPSIELIAFSAASHVGLPNLMYT